MNIYLIINEYHLINNIAPWYYIGSDSKDRFDTYYGSSKSLRRDIDTTGRPWFSKRVLWHGDHLPAGINTLVELEEVFHINSNVVRDHRYYNKVKANTNFTTAGRAVYIYNDDPHNKTVVLPTDHPDVIARKVRGFQKGRNYPKTEEQIEKLRRPLSEKHKRNISQALKGHFKTGNPRGEDTRRRMRKPKSEEHKAKMRKPKTAEHRRKLQCLNEQRQNTPVQQISVDGKAIQTFSSIRDAAMSMGNINKRTSISCCCRGIQQTAYGFRWQYA